MLFVVGNLVHWKYLSLASVFNSVTLKAEITVFPLIIPSEIFVHYAHSTFNRANYIAFAITETRDCCGGKFKLRSFYILRVPLVVLNTVCQVPNVYKSILVSCNQKRVFTAHVVYRHCYVRLAYLLELTLVLPYPKLNI